MRTNKVWRQEDQSGISFLFDATKKYGLTLGLPEIWWIPGPSGGAWDVPRASAYHLAIDILGQEGIAPNVCGRETNSLSDTISSVSDSRRVFHGS